MTARAIPDKYTHRYPDDLDTVIAAVASDEGLSGASPEVRRYELALQVFFKAKIAIAVSSGAAAISTALFAAGVGAGDEVILAPTPPLCTVFPVLAERAIPVFADTAPDHWGADPVSVAKMLTPKTKAIIDTLMWGYPAPVDEMYDFAKANRIPYILDLAHAHGTTLHGESIADFCDLACYSTHDRKPLSTGEGGFVLVADETVADAARAYTRFGNLDGETFGQNYKLNGVAAALGRSRLKYLAAKIETRRENAARLLAAIRHPNVRESDVIPGGQPNYYAVLLRLDFGLPAQNRAFIDYLSAAGIPSDITRYGCRPLYESPTLAAFCRPCPNAEALLSSTTTLPVHPDVTADDIDYMAEVINAYPG